MQHIRVIDLGLCSYDSALAEQQRHFDQLIQNKLSGQSNDGLHVLLLCEHLPVITLGKAAKMEHLLFSEAYLQERGIELVQTGRGGDITYHGPGQIVVYPMLDLDLFFTDLKKYMRFLEEVIIQTIAEFGLEGYRIEGETGVWVKSISDGNPKKICAFGVRTSRWVSMHGLALNVQTDLHAFDLIIPCGIRDKGVSSMKQELSGQEPDMETIKQAIIRNFAQIFEAELIREP